MKKLLCVLCVLLAMICLLCACDTIQKPNIDGGENPEENNNQNNENQDDENQDDNVGGNTTIQPDAQTQMIEAVYNQAKQLGYQGSLIDFLLLCKGDDGISVVSMRIDEQGNLLAYYSNASTTPVNLGRVIGPQGDQGEPGVPPQIRINAENEWEVSTDNGKTWSSTGVKATGPAGAQGNIGASVEKAEFDAQGRLLITMTDGRVLDPIEVPDSILHRHTFGEWLVLAPATCGAPGAKIRTCACGGCEGKEIPATGDHTFGDWKLTSVPTATTKGEETRTCACGATDTREATRILLASSDTVNAIYNYVHADGLGKLPGAYATLTSSGETYQEYEQVATQVIINKMSELLGIGTKKFPILTDKESTSMYEVLIGRPDRAEVREVLATLAPDEIAITVKGQKLVITAWSEAALRTAVKRFLYVILPQALVTAESGEKSIVFLMDFSYTERLEDKNWIVDFPKPEGEGIALYNTMDANDGALQFLYMGEGVNVSAYNAYCNKLKAEGYTVYQENTVENSFFKTFINRSTGVSLYVAYNAYAHKNEYGSYEWTISKKVDSAVVGNVYDYDPCIRVVSAPLDSANLIPTELLSKQSYVKRTDSSITTIPLYQVAVGSSYVITLEDGRFIVLDGGGVGDNGGNEHEVLWQTLRSLYTRIYGQEPTKSNPIRIAAWVLSHGHWDHYYAFESMLQKYGSTGLLKMDYMIANLPAEDSVYAMPIDTIVSSTYVQQLQGYVSGFTHVKVHTGQKLYFANTVLEVLTTWEDLNPLVSNNGNDTNTVIRFEFFNQNAPSSAPISFLYTADANRWQSRFLCATYGDYLKSDMMTVAHHGNVGCEIELYEKVSPTAIWWPHNAQAVKNYLNPSKNGNAIPYEVDQYFAYEMSCVKYIFTAGGTNSYGYSDYSYGFTTVVLTKDGPDFDHAYDLWTGESIIYTTLNEDGTEVSPCMKK